MDKQKYGDHLDDKFFETQKAKSNKEKIWEELDLNKPKNKTYRSLGLFLLVGGVALLLSWYMWSRHTSNQKNNEKLEIRYAGLQERYNTLNNSYEKLTKQLASVKLDQETIKDKSLQTSIEREVVIEYIDRIAYRTDTVFVNVEPKIVFEDRVILDTVYIDHIVEIQADALAESISESENIVKRRGEELVFHLENGNKD